jgi:hypothetical protein
MDLERSRLKIPIIDFASITYLPDTKSKSLSNLEISLTKDLTFSMEFNEICTVFIDKPPFVFQLSKLILKVYDIKVKEQTVQNSMENECKYDKKR